ncbi:hypothetical protein KKH36_00025 [Patescibacteria group bacterium]|nr:hypothetical protein [Patescibacteria group bacterium]
METRPATKEEVKAFLETNCGTPILNNNFISKLLGDTTLCLSFDFNKDTIGIEFNTCGEPSYFTSEITTKNEKGVWVTIPVSFSY